MEFLLESEEGHRMPSEIEALARRVIGAAIDVHTQLGPGLLERAYTIGLAGRLRQLGIVCRTEVNVPVVVSGERLEAGFRADIIVEDKILLEIKSVEEIHPVHKAQTLTYLKLTGLPLGYVMNFRVARMGSGIKRVANA